MSSWSSIPRAASSNPIRKLGRYGPLKMCYFCVMFSFRSELLWKSPNEMLFAWKLFVLLGSLQKPHSRAQKRLTLTDGLSNFLWPDQKGGLQAGNTGLDSILAEFFSWFCRDRFLFEQAGLFPSKRAGLEEDFASYTVQKKSFFRFLVEIFIFFHEAGCALWVMLWSPVTNVVKSRHKVGMMWVDRCDVSGPMWVDRCATYMMWVDRCTIIQWTVAP